MCHNLGSNSSLKTEYQISIQPDALEEMSSNVWLKKWTIEFQEYQNNELLQYEVLAPTPTESRIPNPLGPC